MGFPIPYIAAQILWLNLVTNGLQDVALAFEPAEKGVLRRPPRHPKEGILTNLMIQRTFLMGTVMAVGTVFIFISNLNSGVPLEQARTVALTTMVFFQFYQALNCRSETLSIFKMNPMANPFFILKHDSRLLCPPRSTLCTSPPVGFQDSAAYSKRMGKYRSNNDNNCHCG